MSLVASMLILAGPALVGRATLPDGSPAANADVLVMDMSAAFASDSYPPIAQGRTMADGTFRIGLPNASVRPGVLVRQGDQAVGFANVFHSYRNRLAIRMRPATEVTGRLVDADGAPVADGEVGVTFMSDQTPLEPYGNNLILLMPRDLPGYTARADAEGRFRIGGIPKGCLAAIGPAKSGFRSALGGPSPVVTAVGGGPAVQVSLPKMVPISGTVVHEGKPEPNAVVEFGGLNGSKNVRVLTNSEGAFRTEIPTGTATVSATTVGGRSRSIPRPLVLIPPGIEGLSLNLVPTGIVRGETRANLTVEAVSMAPTIGESAPVYFNDSVVAGPDGRFTFHLAPGQWHLWVQTANESASADVAVSSGSSSEAQLVWRRNAVDTSTRLLRVVGPDGKPVSGAYLANGLTAERTGEDGILTLDRSSANQAVYVTDGRGRFGRYDPASKVEPTVVRLAPGVRIAGQIVRTDGRALPDARVSVQGPRPSVFATIGSGPDGRFAALVPAGEKVRLFVARPGFASHELPELDSAKLPASVSLVATGGTVDVLAQDAASGEPVAGASVTAMWETARAGSTDRGQAYSSSDRQGMARLDGLKPGGSAKVTVNHPAYLPEFEVPASEGRTVLVKLRRQTIPPAVEVAAGLPLPPLDGFQWIGAPPETPFDGILAFLPSPSPWIDTFLKPAADKKVAAVFEPTVSDEEVAEWRKGHPEIVWAARGPTEEGAWAALMARFGVPAAPHAWRVEKGKVIEALPFVIEGPSAPIPAVREGPGGG